MHFHVYKKKKNNNNNKNICLYLYNGYIIWKVYDLM